MGWALSRSWGILPPFGTFLDPFSGAWQQVQPLPVPDRLSDLTAPAEVVFDQHAIPHIYAKNTRDAFFLQGYLTARDRLWQMEFQTHAAAGRLSEIIGENTAIEEFDREMRRTGMVFSAEKSLEEMQKDPMTKEAIEAYAQGVNAWISQLKPKDYPLEYKLLDYAPETWTPKKSALLLKYMARDLAMGHRDLEYTNALRALGKETFQLLFPSRPAPDPIVERPGEWNFDPVRLPDTLHPVPFLEQSLKKPLIETPIPDWGSNNWAVDSSKTASGNPILCGDPHLGLSLPSLWYQIHMHTPDFQVSGASLPGSPAVIIGFNDSVAWSPTNSAADLVDWYKITFEDQKRDRYFFEGEWRFTKKRVEEIRRKGQNSLFDTVVYTHFGPVVYDRNFGADGEEVDLAMRWIAHEPSNELRTFLLLNRAQNYTDYREALRGYVSPAQNFAFAAASGDIAMSIQGRFPLRYPDQGKFILDGRYARNEWQRYIPQEHNPYMHNPERGYISSANQFPVDSTYPYSFFHYSYEIDRNRVLNRILDTLKEATPQDMMAIQNNNFSYEAHDALPLMLRQLEGMQLSEAQQKAYDALQSWDYLYEPDAEAPIYFEAWWNTLEDLAWDEFASDTFALYPPNEDVLIRLLQDTTNFALFDRLDTPERETGNDLIRQAFQTAVEELVSWSESSETPFAWYAYKGTRIRHVARVSGLGRENVPIGGNKGILNAAGETWGPSWRMIVELTPKGPKAWGIYPGGQSGNPASPFYDNFIDKWVEGSYHQILFRHKPEDIPSPLSRHQISPTP